MKKYFILGLALVILAMVSGCGTVYSAAVDERNVKTIANDTAIKTNIVKQFVQDDTVKILDISTSCYQGHVYLVGEYVTKKQKNRAIEIAKKTEGVREVTTYLLPKKRGDLCGTSDNLGIMAKVKAKLVGDKEIWSTNITIRTVQCHVVLVGLVGSKQQIKKAINYAGNVPGVRSVKSFLMSTQ